MKRKICVITATRAEYGLMKCLMEDIRTDEELELQLIVTGSHLAPEFGYTIEQIRTDGFFVNKTIEILLSSDTPVGVSKGMGLAQISFAEAYADISPDIIVVLGDRYELIPIVSAANIARIPVAHLNGGELTEGAVDEIFRHAITKMSQLHFTAIDEYARRVIRMGEQPSRVFNVGEAGLDNLKRLPLMSKSELESAIGRPLMQKNLLVTYHPETCDAIGNVEKKFQCLLDVLNECKDTLLVFTHANADVGGRIINRMIIDYVNSHPARAIHFQSLGQKRYLSALQYVDAVVGNSSSGIVEAASFHIGSINIGDRQKGRIRADNVIDVDATQESIRSGLTRLYSPGFQAMLASVVNPYGQGDASGRIKDVLKSFDLAQLKTKIFYDAGQ